MKDLETVKMILGILGASGGTVAFTYSTFTTKEYVKEAIIERLDRIESKLDRLMEKQDQIELPKPSKKKEYCPEIDYD